MLLVRTLIKPSTIHGNGVFSDEEIPRHTVVWQFQPLFDRVILDEELEEMPSAFRDYLDFYAYHSSDLAGRRILPCDHAKFLNHSADPNTVELPFKSIASRLIKKGEEITCDYGAFCVGWTGFDNE